MGTTTSSRRFIDVYREIRALLPDDLATTLSQKANYWAPEICWQKLATFVNNNIKPSASDETSVKIYAALCGKSEEDMRKAFLENGDI